MKAYFYIELPLWLVLIVVCLFVFPFGVLIGIAGLIFTTIRIVIWYVKRGDEKRQNAIAKAVAELPKNEQLEWGNRKGRYSIPHTVPRNLSTKFMNADERKRYDNRTGEFSERETPYKLEWSAEPSAYETHLIRRHNNPYFAEPRRIVSREELEEAKKIDRRDCIAVEERFKELMQEFDAYINSSVRLSGDAIKLRERLEDFVRF